jgi:predicted SAM-dependent methyltransferase
MSQSLELDRNHAAVQGSRTVSEATSGSAKGKPGMHRVNVGCGLAPTPGWLNFDNSLGIRLAAYPTLVSLLHKLKLLNRAQMDKIEFSQKHKIFWADGSKSIPLPDESVEILYSSHMIEHLDRIEAKLFLQEAKRVLAPGGIIRLAVPDLAKLVSEYLDHGDADAFIEATVMGIPRPRTLVERINLVLVGTRHHQWMFDRKSLCKLLTESGFKSAEPVAPGTTQIPNHEPLNLYERLDESLYVEATKP